MKAMHKFGFGVLLLAGLVALAGCGSSAKKTTGAVVEDRSISRDEMNDIDGQRATTQGIRDADAAGTTMLDGESDGSLSVRTIYFEYDSSNIREEYRRVVEAHANALASRPSQVITLEGHADERGSREYNLALGERRAQAVRRQMVLLGAAAGQIRVVSFGEERPANDGSNEEAYALNRRVEIKY
ncbi:MAG: peptidoglycan-associated lipoprotein Pal [Gammaproteobacteria bacterium]|nr:peptidoglycan-associated lipoprotein Pal [Gammaproteobacteria bacterium]